MGGSGTGARASGARAWSHATAAVRSLRHAGAHGATRRRRRGASGTRAQGRGARRRRAAAASRFGEEIKLQEEDYVMQGRRHEIEGEFQERHRRDAPERWIVK
ncbi:unnamed protein product [Urochloa humidicola]